MRVLAETAMHGRARQASRVLRCCAFPHATGTRLGAFELAASTRSWRRRQESERERAIVPDCQRQSGQLVVSHTLESARSLLRQRFRRGNAGTGCPRESARRRRRTKRTRQGRTSSTRAARYSTKKYRSVHPQSGADPAWMRREVDLERSEATDEASASVQLLLRPGQMLSLCSLIRQEGRANRIATSEPRQKCFRAASSAEGKRCA